MLLQEGPVSRSVWIIQNIKVIDGGLLEMFDLRMATNIPTSIPQICQIAIGFAKNKESVHGPSTGFAMSWYVVVSPDLVPELGALGRSFKIHR
jgi:hypothetical protein